MGIHPSLFLFALLSCCFSGCISGAGSSRKELRTKEVDGQHINKWSGRTNVIDPSRVTEVAWGPRVFLYRNFLSDKECDHLISWLHRERNNTVAGADVEEIDIEDEVAERIEERISAWTFIPKENGRPLQVLHHEVEESKQNHKNIGEEFIKLPSEPLMATVVMYLSNASQGGQIFFPMSENKILSDCRRISMALNPTKGNAIVFFNTHLNGSPDNSSSYARCPHFGGDMWYATKFFYLRAFRREKDALWLDGTDCTDEDENCPDWAASGECQRNPIFMVGSPDYYGTCRKSCKACGSQE